MSSDNVVQWPGITNVDITPDSLLDKARKWDMEHCLIAGHTESGELCFGATTCDTAEVLLMLERARISLMADVAKENANQ